MANSNNRCKTCGRIAVERVTETRNGTTRTFFLCVKHVAQRLINEAHNG